MYFSKRSIVQAMMSLASALCQPTNPKKSTARARIKKFINPYQFNDLAEHNLTNDRKQNTVTTSNARC